MSKYVAKHAPEDSDDVDHEWYVEHEDGDRLVEWNGLRNSEAHIIAFALNAVAEGKTIGSRQPPPRSGKHNAGEPFFEWYNGPTEGVTA